MDIDEIKELFGLDNSLDIDSNDNDFSDDSDVYNEDTAIYNSEMNNPHSISFDAHSCWENEGCKKKMSTQNAVYYVIHGKV